MCSENIVINDEYHVTSIMQVNCQLEWISGRDHSLPAIQTFGIVLPENPSLHYITPLRMIEKCHKNTAVNSRKYCNATVSRAFHALFGGTNYFIDQSEINWKFLTLRTYFNPYMKSLPCKQCPCPRVPPCWKTYRSKWTNFKPLNMKPPHIPI